MSKVICIGGGAAGMFAAYNAANLGADVVLLEKNEKLGKKIYITGKGRCNLTNASEMEVLFNNVMSNRKFLYSAFYACDNDAVLDFFHEYGLKTKVERGNRVFPESDHSSDVIGTLKRALDRKNVEVHLKTNVREIIVKDGVACGVKTDAGQVFEADHVIVATGGFSYQATGSTGDGYRFAKETGHKIIEPSPALVPMEIKEDWCMDLQGLSLRNIAITIKNGKKKVYDDFGELLFTHFGVSGPVILSATSALKSSLFDNELDLFIDLKPALSVEELDKRVLRDFDDAKNKEFKNSIGKLFPSKLIPVMVELSAIDPDKKVNEVTKEERRRFVELIKNLPLTIIGLRGFNEAIITKGGVSVKDIDPGTMESKLIKNLHFCGEVLDLDAMTGGYNLQIAWSTGYLAGISCLD